jgi:hypothetical protein
VPLLPRRVTDGGAKDDQALHGRDHCCHGRESGRGVDERVRAHAVHPGLAHIQRHLRRVRDESRVRCEAVGGRAQNIDVVVTRETRTPGWSPRTLRRTGWKASVKSAGPSGLPCCTPLSERKKSFLPSQSAGASPPSHPKTKSLTSGMCASVCRRMADRAMLLNAFFMSTDKTHQSGFDSNMTRTACAIAARYRP